MKKILQSIHVIRLSSGIAFLISLFILPAKAQNIPTGFNGTQVNTIDGTNDNTLLHMYPNPAADEAKIVFNSSRYDMRYQVRIVNNAGIPLKNIEGLTVQGQNTINIHVGDFPPGVYYIQLLTPAGRKTLKFLKQPLNNL